MAQKQVDMQNEAVVNSIEQAERMAEVLKEGQTTSSTGMEVEPKKKRVYTKKPKAETQVGTIPEKPKKAPKKAPAEKKVRNKSEEEPKARPKKVKRQDAIVAAEPPVKKRKRSPSPSESSESLVTIEDLFLEIDDIHDAIDQMNEVIAALVEDVEMLQQPKGKKTARNGTEFLLNK